MSRAIYAAATGMAAQQRTLDVIANDLANADVPGFKSSVVRFASIGNTQVLGTAERAVLPVFSQGKLEHSGGPLDIAIDGAGFFQVERDGERAYTRAGSFQRASDGSVRNADGWSLAGVHIPADALSVRVGNDGRVAVDLHGAKNLKVGEIKLAAFAAPERLRPSGRRFLPPLQARGLRASSKPAATESRKLHSGCSKNPTFPSSRR